MTAMLQYSIPPLCNEGAVMDEPKVIEGTIAADWWTLAGALQALLTFHYDHDDTAPSYVSGPDRDGYKFDLTDRRQIGRLLATISFSIGASPTTIKITSSADPRVYGLCHDLYQFLDLFAGGARIFLRQFQPDPEKVIERYYLQRAQGIKVTLRQLAEETGISYGALRKRKMDYDRAGKLGSKRNKIGTK